jgi:signal peptidase II
VKPRISGALTALAVLLADHASKYWVLYGLKLQSDERVVVAPFLNFELHWNPGVSFSLFQQDTAAGRWMLLGLTLAATVLLSIWLWRVGSRLAAFGLGAIVGGALGNGYDRFIYGAVVDFLDFHAFGYHFYVFNLADSAITLGVVVLLLDSVLTDRRARPPAGETV